MAEPERYRGLTIHLCVYDEVAHWFSEPLEDDDTPEGDTQHNS